MPIVHGPWEKYPWKNELAVQSERVAIHYAEMMSDAFDGEHCPMDMLDRAIVLAAFAMRRMFEKRLVTDKLDVRKSPFEHSRPFVWESSDGLISATADGSARIASTDRGVCHVHQHCRRYPHNRVRRLSGSCAACPGDNCPFWWPRHRWRGKSRSAGRRSHARTDFHHRISDRRCGAAMVSVEGLSGGAEGSAVSVARTRAPYRG